jgi:ubiquitin C-terminal hydrolase
VEVNFKKLHHHAVPVGLMFAVVLILGLVREANTKVVINALIQPHVRVHPRPNGLASVTFHSPQNSGAYHSSVQTVGKDAVTSLILQDQ